MLKLILSISFCVISVSAQAAGMGEVFGALMSKSGAANSDQAVDEVLAKMSVRMNRKLPVSVDKDTRLDRVSAVPGQHFIYHYTLVNLGANDVNTDTFHKKFKPRLKDRLCGSTEMQNFLKNGVSISYLYKGKEGAPIGGAKFAPSDCGYN